ncbi:glucosidase [Pannus brasiliensis CCIBt3594]|uniref:Glucosidase n=1 Tax=Pannus brasiliensis CCIBt3594 TaxID=1427578 RepID=A0AAW9R1Q3_9CHRO
MTAEENRLAEDQAHTAYWKRWGPYLSERQWGTVREDYSSTGEAWDYISHDRARSYAYRWGEDGIAGISDNHQRLCFAIALWNGEDPILKERLFGLTGSEGNHGEDVKEYYFYLDNTPTHSYMKYLYKYPQSAFPYSQLVEENRHRDRHQPEFELVDTGIFSEHRYFDVFVEYGKNSPEDILINLTIVNRGPDFKPLHLLPTLWFRNTWSWADKVEKPSLKVRHSDVNFSVIEASHSTLGQRWLYCEGNAELLFTENETNHRRLWQGANTSDFVKDGIHEYLIQNKTLASEDSVHEYLIQNKTPTINPDRIGTKVAAHYALGIPPGATQVIRLRLSDSPDLTDPFGAEFERILQTRLAEADEFYDRLASPNLSPDQRNIQRQAFAGMLWSKQYYYYVVERWLDGDEGRIPPPEWRQQGRNSRWRHLHCDDILSMPDKWEYPWFAAWDLAFHAIPLTMVDPAFAKRQLQRLTREWYMHPNGQLPAYEWSFDDVNPPVHAWATIRVYQLEQKIYGRSDLEFVERIFQKLSLNFTWWVNREDRVGNNVFQGGFLGLDNIGVFDRSKPLPTGGYMQQSDGTSWMAMYCLNLLTIALELSQRNPVYEDIASKFFEHFIYIAAAMNGVGKSSTKLWDDTDRFYYDVLNLPDGRQIQLKVRSMVGLTSLFAAALIPQETIDRLPDFKRRATWFLENRPHLIEDIGYLTSRGEGNLRVLSLLSPDRLRSILKRLLDETEFLSPYGVRAVSRYHAANPFSFWVEGEEYRVDYEPAESTTALFGGNSNWRGPIWFPVNYLIIESLLKFHAFWGDNFTVECPTGSGQMMNLQQVARELSRRLIAIFTRDAAGRRPVYGGTELFQTDPHWRDLIPFYEYFHGDNGAGIGASHQTGWTGLIARLIQQ